MVKTRARRRTSPRRPSGRAYLASRVRPGVKFGLETISVLMEALKHPERCAPSLLVAGTNGKGSVVAYVAAVLQASGFKVGRYTSPHLVRVNERISVAGREITEGDLDLALGAVRRAATRLLQEGILGAHPTYFEALTAAAFHHFERRLAEVMVLEVGMGGRLDATNVSAPLVSAIVSIDRDHEAFLGDTLGAIAREKAGVLRPGRPTVLGPLPADARGAIAAAAEAVGARLVDARSGCTVAESVEGLEVRTPRGVYRGVRTLPGAHQRDNALVAIRLLEEAADAGLPVDLALIPEGFERTVWPGRLQWIPGKPPLLLDGAHNPAGARALAAYLAGLPPFVLLFGAMADKDVAELGGILFPLAADLVLTRPRVDRAATPREIAQRAGAAAQGARLEADPGRALALARRLARPERPVVVAGSLYLVGEVLRLLARARK